MDSGPIAINQLIYATDCSESLSAKNAGCRLLPCWGACCDPGRPRAFVRLWPLLALMWTSVNERDGIGDDLVPDYVTRVQEGP